MPGGDEVRTALLLAAQILVALGGRARPARAERVAGEQRQRAAERRDEAVPGVARRLVAHAPQQQARQRVQRV